VCIVLKYWIENQFRDFDQDMVAKLFSFIEKVLPNDGNGYLSFSLPLSLDNFTSSLILFPLSLFPLLIIN
jgi:hypothetical protein